MVSEGVKFKYLDASALIKLYISKNEKGFRQLREFSNAGTNFFTTWLCLAEALGVLKRKWNKKEIKTDEYFNAITFLLIEWRDRIESDDIKSIDPSVPLQVKRIAEKYNLDYSDALLLLRINILHPAPSLKELKFGTVKLNQRRNGLINT
jgi:predicted nucleic acid-binding protein